MKKMDYITYEGLRRNILYNNPPFFVMDYITYEGLRRPYFCYSVLMCTSMDYITYEGLRLYNTSPGSRFMTSKDYITYEGLRHFFFLLFIYESYLRITLPMRD